MNTLLKAESLYKTFGEKKDEQITVLNNIDLKIDEGEFVAIMGQSGSGKSTLLYNISGMDKVTSGEIIFDGENISAMTEEQMSILRLNKMGFIFQQSYLLKNMSIEDNIILPGYKSGKYSKKEVEKKAINLMKKLGIHHIANNDITKVSGGQLQRAAICRALINEPKIIFGDEPTGALNSSATMDVMNIFNTINEEGTTILVVTHDARVAGRAQRIIFLKDGGIEEECLLDKYNEKDLKNREDKLDVFLDKMNF